MRLILLASVLLSATLLTAGESHAQGLVGPFSFQLQPYCNVLTLVAEPKGPVFAVFGSDDNCGASSPSGIIGTAVPGQDMTLMYLTIHGTDHVAIETSASLDMSTLSGHWRDGLGHSGNFTMAPTAQMDPMGPMGSGVQGPSHPHGSPMTAAGAP